MELLVYVKEMSPDLYVRDHCYNTKFIDTNNIFMCSTSLINLKLHRLHGEEIAPKATSFNLQDINIGYTTNFKLR